MAVVAVSTLSMTLAYLDKDVITYAVPWLVRLDHDTLCFTPQSSVHQVSAKCLMQFAGFLEGRWKHYGIRLSDAFEIIIYKFGFVLCAYSCKFILLKFDLSCTSVDV